MVMVQISSILKVADNSGARILFCIHTPKEAKRLGAFPGMLIRASVRRVILRKRLKKSRVLKEGQLCTALVVRTVYGFKRWGNFFFSASSNSVVLVNKYLLPVGSRLFGPIFREIRSKKFFKIIAKSEVAL
uniref:Ribosomal protein L14 n=1 Tax=Balamuthia mandrillaris TaxID=66527 RepID=A0A0K1HRT7_9EUKA|nr:ribosomal protein L14 [Balamuthia mandrillaris]AKT94913.1 ribosomal protein L14 [Balamuthia mandrillaris]